MTTITAAECIDTLRALRACSKPGEAIPWAESLPAETTAAEAWALCRRGDWLVWLLGSLHVRGLLSRQTLVLAASAAARTALCNAAPREDRPRIAIETAEAWTRGGASIAVDFQDAADAAASAAAYYAAYAASSAFAACAAASAASAADAAAAAYAAAADAADAAAYAAFVADAAAFAADAAASAAAAYDASYDASACYAASSASSACADAAASAAAASRAKRLADIADAVRASVSWETVEAAVMGVS